MILKTACTGGPENKSIILLGEEIEYLKSFLEQNNQWNHPIPNYFTEDLCFHISDLYKRKEPVPFEGVLFCANRLITRRMYEVFINLIEYQILLNQLELNNKFVIKELSSSFGIWMNSDGRPNGPAKSTNESPASRAQIFFVE